MSSSRPDVARALPDYDLGDELGRGEFGVVWRGRHRQLHRDVAVKQLAGLPSAEYGARFRREARILARLDHPHVVTVYDYREQDDLRLIVMELLPGGTFADRRAAGLTFETAIASAMAAASGLHHGHEHGILHRDVKPENLMFDGRGTLKVTDFGIARGDAAESTVVNITHAGEFFGTPAYVSPEQAGHALAEGWPAIGPATDQYSLAAVLYEALSGELTHDASGGALGLCNRRMNEEARPLGEVAPGMPASIEAVVMRALARDPSQRFDSTADFAVALGNATTDTIGPDWLARSDLRLRDTGEIFDSAHRPSPPPSTAALVEVARVEVAPAAPSPPIAPAAVPRRSQPLYQGVALVVVLLVLAVGSFAFFKDRSAGGSAAKTTAPPTVAASRELHLSQAWATATVGGVFSSPATSGGVIVVGSDDGGVYAVDAASGTRRWKVSTGAPVRSSPVTVGGVVYVGSNDGNLYAIDLGSGKIRWKTSVGYEIVSSPAVSNGLVVVGSNRLYAFSASTGTARWTFKPQAAIVSSPAIADGVVVVGSNDHEIYGIDLATGSERWHLRTGDAIQSSPDILGGMAYVSGRDGYLYAVTVTTGKSPWATDLGSAMSSSPTVAGGRLFVGTDAGRLVSVNPTSGAVQWSYQAPDRIDSSPTTVAHLVVVGSDDGKVYAVEADSGALAGSFTTAAPVLSSPLAVGNDIVVGSQDRKLYRITGFGG